MNAPVRLKMPGHAVRLWMQPGGFHNAGPNICRGRPRTHPLFILTPPLALLVRAPGGSPEVAPGTHVETVSRTSPPKQLSRAAGNSLAPGRAPLETSSLSLAHPKGTARRFFYSKVPHHRYTLVTYNAGISACENGEQWQRAAALLSEMWDTRLELNVISYNAGISTCEKGEQWQRALALLSEMGEAVLKADVITYSAGISACKKGEQWLRALLLLSEMWEADLKPNVISYNAGISACENGEQWQRALSLLSEMQETMLKPDVISYSAGICACGKGEQWQRALALLSEMWEAKLEPNVISSTMPAPVRAKRGEQ